MRRRAGILLVAAIVMGCTQAAPPTSTSQPSSPAQAPVDTPGPLDPNVIGLSCGDGPVFHPALLEGPGRAELDGDAAGAALRAELARNGGAPEFGYPPGGWTRVAQTADRVTFLASHASGDGWVVVRFALRQGQWQLDATGACQLMPAVPPGMSIAAWWLDPNFPDPRPDDREIHVVLNERACASGQSPKGRVEPPTIVSGPTSVTITLVVRSRPGGQDCPGNPDLPMTIELLEPLGDRRILDGGVFPPQVVTKPVG